MTDFGERLRLQLIPATGKADLTNTPLWQYLASQENEEKEEDSHE